jgi:hypothetical protein
MNGSVTSVRTSAGDPPTRGPALPAIDRFDDIVPREVETFAVEGARVVIGVDDQNTHGGGGHAYL